jgi:23S rRNA (pseudouridine1915-N3)-methyltransferase
LKYTFLFLGKTRQAYLDAGIADYASRLGRYARVEIRIIKERYSNRDTDAAIRRKGGDLLLEHCSPKSFKVALDPGGKQYDSPGLARQLSAWRDQGRQELVFLLGGHVGLDRSVIQAADALWSLSRLTFTHEMSRLIMLEQLYRAWTIVEGGQYHK